MKMKRTFRIPFSKEELETIEKLRDTVDLRRATFVTKMLIEQLKEFENRNKFSISLNFDFEVKEIKNPYYIQIYIDETVHKRLTGFSKTTKLSVPQLSRYLLIPEIEKRKGAKSV